VVCADVNLYQSNSINNKSLALYIGGTFESYFFTSGIQSGVIEPQKDTTHTFCAGTNRSGTIQIRANKEEGSSLDWEVDDIHKYAGNYGSDGNNLSFESGSYDDWTATISPHAQCNNRDNDIDLNVASIHTTDGYFSSKCAVKNTTADLPNEVGCFCKLEHDVISLGENDDVCYDATLKWAGGYIAGEMRIVTQVGGTTIDTFVMDSGDQNTINHCFNSGANTGALVFLMGSGSINTNPHLYLDNVRVEGEDYGLLVQIFKQKDPVGLAEDMLYKAKVWDYGESDYNTTATCDLGFTDSVFQYSMPYNASTEFYEVTHALYSTGIHDFNVSCTAGSLTDSNTSTIEVNTPIASYITITDIENVTHTATDQNAYFTPVDHSKQIIWHVDSNYSAGSIDVTFNIYNNNHDARQYWIYTASEDLYDAGIWVFNDTLTYGSSTNYDDPIQKIWDEGRSRYTFTFEDTITADENKYYRLVFKYPMRYWDSIADSTEWDNGLIPEEVDLNGETFDKFAISGYSDINSMLIVSAIPELISDYYVPYEFQFNAYTDFNEHTLVVGVVQDDGGSWKTQSAKRILISKNDEQRFSVDINALDKNQFLYIHSNDLNVNTLYLGLYALIQRGYFKTDLELRTKFNDPLPLRIDSAGTTYKYLNEGDPFRIFTTLYDRMGDLNHYTIDVYFEQIADENRVGYYQYNFSTSEGKIITLNDLLDGIIDLVHCESKASDIPDVKVTLTIWDDNSMDVQEQSVWVKMHQFPFFSTDLEFYFNQ
jgi:hypothetical protein